MTYKEFLMYLEENFDGYKIFMQKAIDFQQKKTKIAQLRSVGIKPRLKRPLMKCGNKACKHFIII